MRARFSWLLPDLAMVAAAVALFYCLFLFQGYRKLFRDSDAGWHIVNGELILEARALPRADPFSFTKAGEPWLAWEWGADVATGAIHRAAGLRGVALFYSVVIAAGVWMWFRLNWAMGGNFLIACAMASLLLSTCNIHWLARPHVIGWLLLVSVVWWSERRGPLWILAVLMVIWGNVHASFFLGTLAVAALTRRIGAIAVALLAPLINPYGWRLYDHVLRYLTDSELLGRIGEFQSFDFRVDSGQILATVILGIAGGTLALTQKKYGHFALAMVLSAIALRSARGLPLVALILLPIANGAIAARWPWPYADRLRKLDVRMSGLALAPVVILGAWLLLARLPAGFPPDQFPVAAFERLDPGRRLFAPDKFGGYLIYRSKGARKVFFDGRSDLFGAEFLKKYGRIVQLRPGWRQTWESFGFTEALLPNDAPLVEALKLIGWTQVYQDGTATILRPGRT